MYEIIEREKTGCRCTEYREPSHLQPYAVHSSCILIYKATSQEQPQCLSRAIKIIHGTRLYVCQPKTNINFLFRVGTIPHSARLYSCKIEKICLWTRTVSTLGVEGRGWMLSRERYFIFKSHNAFVRDCNKSPYGTPDIQNIIFLRIGKSLNSDEDPLIRNLIFIVTDLLLISQVV